MQYKGGKPKFEELVFDSSGEVAMLEEDFDLEEENYSDVHTEQDDSYGQWE